MQLYFKNNGYNQIEKNLKLKKILLLFKVFKKSIILVLKYLTYHYAIEVKKKINFLVKSIYLFKSENLFNFLRRGLAIAK